jgi:calcineurin-like phosphoesterase family protein
MSNIFFTADSHFGHAKIIQYCNRPFSSAGEMDEALVENWNKVVKPGDLIYHLGDVAFVKDSTEVVKLLRRLHGTIHLVSGNHDDHLDWNKISADLKDKLRVHYRLVELKGSKWHPYRPTLCHYPLDSWNGSFHGSFHLHGHTHGTVPFDPVRRRLDVGVDSNDFTPVAWEAIIQKLESVPTPKSLINSASNGVSYGDH